MRLDDQINKSISVFIEAVKEGNVLIVDSLLDNLLKHVSMTEIVDPVYTGNPLHWAANEGQLDILKKLIAKCPQAINSTTSNGSTPLLNAVTNNHYSEMIYLLQHNASPTISNHNSENAFSAAFKKADNHPIKIYMQEYRDLLNKNFKEAILEYSWEQAEELLNKGADIETSIRNIDDKIQHTALFHFCCIGNTEMVKKLIARKANVNIVGAKNGFSALHAAANFGYVEIVNLLLEAGANCLARDITGNTPLDIAKTRQIPQIIASLEAKSTKVTPVTIQPQLQKINETTSRNYSSSFITHSTSKPELTLEERFGKLKGNYFFQTNNKSQVAEKTRKAITLEELREEVKALSTYVAQLEEAGPNCINMFNSKCTLPTQQTMKVDLSEFMTYLKSIKKSIEVLNQCFAQEDVKEITKTIVKDYKIENTCSKMVGATNNVQGALSHKILPSQEYYQDYTKLFDGLKLLEEKAGHLQKQVKKIHNNKLTLAEPVSSLEYN
ncbi:ankyrin repeat domain-containing protein [Legionella gresilensis]|uniref:ankyrin repeat domain-containing protein n=1 Tax=Legionella gresilensis TaxID=91823 RepID=UPI0013EFAB42|nr:ankyrin repeat domain-containing protein [Legionella gresilensis]